MFTKFNSVEEILNYNYKFFIDKFWLEKQKLSLKNFYNSSNYNLNELDIVLVVKINNEERLSNLKTVIEFLNYHFKNKIYIFEYDYKSKIDFNGNYHKILIKPQTNYFKRNLVQNIAYTYLNNKIILNLEADVLLDPKSIHDSYHSVLENKKQLNLPFDGVPIWLNEIATIKYKSDKILPEMWKNYYNIENYLEKSYHPNITKSISEHPGFCYMINFEVFKSIGLENSNMTGHGWDDIERIIRSRTLGLKINYGNGVAYHLYHTRSKSKDNWYKSDNTNHNECVKVANMNYEQLQQYIKTWNNDKFNP